MSIYNLFSLDMQDTNTVFIVFQVIALTMIGGLAALSFYQRRLRLFSNNPDIHQNLDKNLDTNFIHDSQILDNQEMPIPDLNPDYNPDYNVV